MLHWSATAGNIQGSIFRTNRRNPVGGLLCHGRDGQVLRGSRVMLLEQKTGTIHYDGSANDEG